MTNEKSSRFQVYLEYSLDSVKDEFKKMDNLRKGSDIVTATLNKFKVDYSLSFASDFHFPEPILEKVTQTGKDSKEYELYNSWRDSFGFSPICGSGVLRFLVSLGIIKNVE